MNQRGGSETESSNNAHHSGWTDFDPARGGPSDGSRSEIEALKRRILELESSQQEMVRLAAESDRQHRLYETVLSNTPDFVYVFSLDHRVIYANESLIKMWGTGYEGAIGKTFLEIGYEPWHAEMHDREIDEVRASKQPIRGEVPFNGTFGRRIYDYIFVPIFGADGEVEAVAGTTRDVTERKQTEREFREGQEQLDFALAAADLGHWSLNLSDHTAHRTLRHDQIFGYDSLLPEWTYAMFLDHVLPEDREEVDAAFKQSIATGSIWAVECRIRRADGEKRYLWTRGLVKHDDAGQPERMLGILGDITDRRVLEEQQTFLIRLSDALRPLSDPIVAQAEASRLLGEHLGASQVAYFEICGDEYVVERDYTNGVPSMAGRYPLTSFGMEPLTILSAGKTAFEADIHENPTRTDSEKNAFASLNTRAILGVPLVKEGKFVAGLAVHSSTVRNWTPTEISTVEQTAERTWAAVERARAQAELVKSEERSAFVRRSSGVGFWYCDLPFEMLQWDDLVKEHFHLPADASVTIERFYELIHPEDREPTRVAIDKSISEGSHYDVVYRTVHPQSDSIKYIRAIGRTFYDSHGSAISFDGITLDVSEQVRTEASVRESEERFRLVADAAPVLIWLSGTDKQAYWFNQPWIQFTGRTMEEEIADGWIDCVHPEDRVSLIQTYFEAFEARIPFSLEGRLRRHDGEYRWMIDNGVPRFGADGEFQGYIGSCLDVTDYKNAEAALRDADRRKDEFLATLAHELRNPLAPIGSGLEIMRMADYAPGPVAKTSRMMERQLKQMVRLIDDLMDVSRINSGKLVLQKEPVTLASVVESAVETSRPLIQQMDHELTVQLPEPSVTLDVDLTRLAQVFSNLLNNAAKYTERGGQIWLTAHRVGNEIIVSVKDSGIGIEPEDLPRLFDMFSQVNTSLGRAQGGLGIGLMLVKRLVEMHGGSIEAHSDGHGMGSEFVVQLPLVAEEAKTVLSQADMQNGSRDSLRILVVDDNEDIAYTLSSLLEIKGYQTQVAYSGEEALTVAAGFDPELVLLDIGLPEMDGYETCRRLRELVGGAKMTIIAQSGWGGPEDRRRSAEAGFDHHLVKPFIMDQLSKVLEGLR